MKFDAFISYSHAEDHAFAPPFQRALHRFAKPWYRLRALRTFRDTTNLSANPNLWESIVTALDQSEFLLILASKGAAKSEWVPKEIAYWCKNKDPEKMILILTEGEIRWSEKHCDFDWARTNALPAPIQGIFRDEPLFVDFREFKSDELSLRDPKFLDRIASVVATIHGKSKDELFSEDKKQHRRTLTVAWSAVSLILVLLMVAGVFATLTWFANVDLSASRYDEETRRVAAEASASLAEFPRLSLQGALEAVDRVKPGSGRRSPAAEQALHDALSRMGGRGLLGHTDFVSAVAISPDARWVASGSFDKTVRVWDLEATDVSRSVRILQGAGERVTRVEFSPDGKWFYFGSWHDTSFLFDLTRPEPFSSPIELKGNGALVINAGFDPKSDWLFSATHTSDGARLWSLTSKETLPLPTAGLHHFKPARCYAFSADGQLLITGSFAGAVTMWNMDDVARAGQTTEDAVDGRELNRENRHLRIRGEVPAVCISKDKQMVVAANGRDVLLFPLGAQADKATRISLEIPGDGDATQLAISEDNRWLISGSRIDFDNRQFIPRIGFSGGGDLMLWDLQRCLDVTRLNNSITAQELIGERKLQLTPKLLLQDDKAPLTSNLIMSPDGRWVFAGCGDGSVRIWNLSMPHPELESIVIYGHDGPVMSLDLSADGRRLVSGGEDHSVRIWEFDSSYPRGIVRQPLVMTMNEIRVETASENLLSSGDLSWINTFVESLETSQEQPSTPRSDKAFEKIKVSSEEWEVSWWTAKTKWAKDQDSPKEVRNAQLRRLAGDSDSPRNYVLQGHEGKLIDATFSEDGRWLVTACKHRIYTRNETVFRLWDLSSNDPSSRPLRLRGHFGNLKALEIDPNNRWLCSASTDGRIRLWHLSVEGLKKLGLEVSGRSQ